MNSFLLFRVAQSALPVFLATLFAVSVSAESLPRIASVESEGLLFTDNKAGVTGVDGYFSVPIGKQTVWFFGDVFLNDPTDPQKKWHGDVSNCALLTPSGHGRHGLFNYEFLTNSTTGLARPVIPNRPDENNKVRFWPLAAWHDERAHELYLYYNLVHFTEDGGPFGFRVIGYGLTKSDTRDPKKLLFERIKGATGEELWGHTDASPTYGLTIVLGKPGSYLYLVGDEGKKKNPHATLARVHKDKIADQRAYEYFSGTAASPAWSTNVNDAIGIEGFTDFTGSMSVVYNNYLGCYLAVHHVGVTEKIRLSVAPEPWGPYKEIGEIGAPHRAFAKAFCYDGAEHAELQEQNGRIIYISYVDSDRYWEQLYKVTLQFAKPTTP